MAKDSIRDFSATAGSNTDIQSVNIDENCPASGINNAIRELMVDLKNVSTGAVNLETPAADSLTVAGDLTVDTNTLKVDSSNNRVGIGTDVPVHNVEIVATAAGSVNDSLQIRNNATSSGTGSRIRFINSTDANSDANGASIASVRNGNDNDLVFETENSEAMRIDHSGLVGIGTDSPQQLLSLRANNPGAKIRLEMGQSGVADGDVTGEIQFYHNDASGAGVNADIKGICTNSIGAGALTFGTGTTSTTERLRIDSSGNVGIGITPSYLLHVHGMIGGKAVEIGRTGGAGHQGGSHFYLGSDLEDPNGITFTNANYRFSSNRTGSVLAQNSSGSGYLYEGTNDDSSSASRKFGVETDGDVRNTNNSYGSLSDQSIKQDIADASSQWEDIKNLRVRKFRLIADVEADADAPYHLGLVAQEVETVSPGLVKVEIQRDALKDADGNPILDDDGELQMQETGELKAVKYSILYMKAVKALQEAITKIETLETEMTALKARVTALEA
jgi:hypothetical protein